jgi:ketosteroid isomerase-like protein
MPEESLEVVRVTSVAKNVPVTRDEGYLGPTMQENVENRGTEDWVAEARSMLQLGFEALGREDYETLTTGYAPDVELNVFGSQAVGVDERYVGHEGFIEWATDMHSTLTDLSWTLGRVRAGPDFWAAEVFVRGCGRTSGAPVELTFGSVYHLSADRKVVRQDTFFEDGWGRVLEAIERSE